LTVICSGSTSPGITDDQNTLCVATGLLRLDDSGNDDHVTDGSTRHAQIRGLQTEGEELTVWEVPLNIVPSWLEKKRSDGYVVDLRIYAGLYFLASSVSA
jgi:ADP-ribose pyrophosphatase